MEGFKFYEKGNSTDQLKIPYSYTSFTFLPKLSLIPWNGGFLYPKFMAESDLEGGFTDDFYKRTYTDSLFSFQSNEESVRFLISLPQESKFLNGEYHGSLIPVPFLEGKEFYLLNWIRPEILHYQQQGNEFIYQKTVNLDLENWVSYDEVPLNQASKFYDSFGKKMPGTFRDIFSIGDYLVVQYTLGISEDTFSQAKGESGRLDPEKIYQLNPPLLAVLDKELNVLAKGIVLPNGVNGQLVVDRKGRLVGQKNPSLSSVEESNLVLYRMNLKAY
ncbi:hypothetical protein [Algoriphagus boseongensis]|uniref:hypothetical protein n=1 Tax=Algoriphagus boseongensis TaxID=1442587 RepID=UPI00105FD221|nr:hypothetical protein [Algoriphagus boseongensis]